MQHDLYVHPDPHLRRTHPFLVDLQLPISAESHRIVAPLAPTGLTGTRAAHVCPIVVHDRESHLVMMWMRQTVPAGALRRPVGSIAAWRDDLTRAIEWLFSGI